MFDTEIESSAAPDSGHLVTNHLNLLYMLAAGLVLPSTGFGDKYYGDTLDCAPGWIPLFIGDPRAAAVEYSVKETGHLRPCIVEISLKGLSGPVMVAGRDGVEQRQFPENIGRPEIVFVPAPLPVSAIERIVLRSADDRKSCAADAQDHGNVPWTDFTVSRNARLFSKGSGRPWPPPQAPEPRDAPVDQALAAGGVLATLRLMANRCDAAQPHLGVTACRLAFDPPNAPAPELAATVLEGLPRWMRTGRTPAALTAVDDGGRQQEVWRSLFWQATDLLAGGGPGGSAERALLDLLGNASVPSGLQERLARLRRDLESLTGLGTSTVSELFREYKSPLPRAMLLLFLRERCADLFDFEAPALNDEDWLAAAVLFGAREGWLSLPLSLRGNATASNAVAHRMATMCHRMTGSGIDLGPAPERARPIAEQFLGDWNAELQQAALRLARDQRWNCIRTRVTLGQGDYRLLVTRAGTEIVFEGEPKAVASEPDQRKFLRCLAEAIRANPTAELRLFELASVHKPTPAGSRRQRAAANSAAQ